METELANQLIDLASTFGRARGLEESTVGRLCAKDGRFFSRIREGKTFTIRKHDEVLQWFSSNWPEDTRWPIGVPRVPQAPSESAA